MNKWSDLHQQSERNKNEYPPGTRIILLHMGKDPMPVDDFTRGTVKSVDSIGTVHCIFDNGRELGMVPGTDSFRKLTKDELDQEQEKKTAFQNIVSDATERKQNKPVSLNASREETTR